MARLRSDFKSGTITDNPLTNVATTINSAGFSALPVVTAPDILVLVLDPKQSAGAPEIVYVTAHTSSATSVTVTREQEGTTKRQHAVNTAWIHGPTATDFNATATPAASTFADAAVVGTAPEYARADHKHGREANPMQYGTYGSRPAAGTNNRYYWATDKVTLYRDTGAAWEIVSSQFLSGVYSSRPAAGIDNRFYWSTDTKVLYRDNGSSWDVVTSPPSTSWDQTFLLMGA